jgi:hypothetical protein
LNICDLQHRTFHGSHATFTAALPEDPLAPITGNGRNQKKLTVTVFATIDCWAQRAAGRGSLPYLDFVRPRYLGHTSRTANNFYWSSYERDLGFAPPGSIRRGFIFYLKDDTKVET